MNISQMYLIVSIVVLAVIVLLLFVIGKKGKEKKLTPLAGLAFGFLLAGLFFSDNWLIGYGLMGVGVIPAFVDMFNKSKAR
jgi:hypothetical protein